MTPSDILKRYQRGDRDFRGLKIDDPEPYVMEGSRFVSVNEPDSFKTAVLDGADFSAAFIVADFRGAHLRNCKFTGANVKTCAFDSADLTDCDFSNAAIVGATFNAARLDRSNFQGAHQQGHSMKSGEVPRC
jgi:uncharacterized protein YjbI with pentapeptide repeats